MISHVDQLQEVLSKANPHAELVIVRKAGGVMTLDNVIVHQQDPVVMLLISEYDGRAPSAEVKT